MAWGRRDAMCNVFSGIRNAPFFVAHVAVAARKKAAERGDACEPECGIEAQGEPLLAAAHIYIFAGYLLDSRA